MRRGRGGRARAPEQAALEEARAEAERLRAALAEQAVGMRVARLITPAVC